ncbi:PEP-CTERM sorting domain-containing protein [Thiobacillus sp.]
MKAIKFPCALAALFVIAAISSAPAHAVFSFNLIAGNSAISGYAGPYATVDVSLINSTMASVTFTSLTNSGNIYLMGDGGSVAVNVNATNWTLGSITGSNAGTGFTPGTYSDGGTGNEDGFGSFNQKINTFDGFTHSSDTISFSLTNISGTWGSDAAVLAPNSGGSLAAAHIFVTTSPASTSNTALATGFAASVPEADTYAMLLAGLGLVGLAARRKLS